MHRLTLRSLTLVVFETVLIVAAVAAAAYIRLGDWAWVILVQENGAAKTLLAAGVAQTCLYYADLYDLRLASDRPELFVRIVQALGAASFILAVIYFWFPTLIIGRGVFLIAAFLVITLVIGWRLVFVWMSGTWARASACCSWAPSPAAVSLARELYERRHDLGVEIVGFVDADPKLVGTPVVNPGVIGHHRRHPDDRPRRVGRPRRGEPLGCARQAADGEAARDEARRRDLRPSGVGLRGVHGQDRGREPASELADLLVRLSEEPRCWPPASAWSISSPRPSGCCWQCRSWASSRWRSG